MTTRIDRKLFGINLPHVEIQNAKSQFVLGFQRDLHVTDNTSASTTSVKQIELNLDWYAGTQQENSSILKELKNGEASQYSGWGGALRLKVTRIPE